MVRDLLQRSGLLNMSGEKGNGAGNYDGEREPNDTFKRPAKSVLLPHGDQSEDNTGDAKDYNHPQA
jgi:hypothetical protein